LKSSIVGRVERSDTHRLARQMRRHDGYRFAQPILRQEARVAPVSAATRGIVSPHVAALVRATCSCESWAAGRSFIKLTSNALIDGRFPGSEACPMHDRRTPPKLAETVIHPSATLREVEVGACCEVLDQTYIEYTSLGDYSYLGPNCMVAERPHRQVLCDCRLGSHRRTQPSDGPPLAASFHLLSRVLQCGRGSRCGVFQ